MLEGFLEEGAATLLRDGEVVTEFRIYKADFNVAAPQEARKMVLKLAFRQVEDLRERHHEGVIYMTFCDLSEQVSLGGIKPNSTL